MNDNPYESPLTANEPQSQTVDRSPLVLRCVIVSQLIWIAALGATARGIMPETFGVFAFAVPMMPITMLGAPAVALYFASKFGALRFMLIAIVEISLIALQILAIFPAVQ